MWSNHVSFSRGAYTCTYHGCTRRFETPALLHKHNREGHRQTFRSNGATPDQVGPYECQRINPSTGKPCNIVFSRPYDLTRHGDTVHNARNQKIQCDACLDEKLFARVDGLSRHYRVCHPTLEFKGKHRKQVMTASNNGSPFDANNSVKDGEESHQASQTSLLLNDTNNNSSSVSSTIDLSQPDVPCTEDPLRKNLRDTFSRGPGPVTAPARVNTFSMISTFSRVAQSPVRGPYHQRSSSGAGSTSSVDSGRSKASQRSWEEEDQFDQVLNEIAKTIEETINGKLFKGNFGFRDLFTKGGHSRREIQRSMKKELADFSVKIRNRANFGQAPEFTRSSEYRNRRGQ